MEIPGGGAPAASRPPSPRVRGEGWGEGSAAFTCGVRSTLGGPVEGDPGGGAPAVSLTPSPRLRGEGWGEGSAAFTCAVRSTLGGPVDGDPGGRRPLTRRACRLG